MSDTETENVEVTELGYGQELTDAVNGFMNDDEAPEVEASTEEPTEQLEANEEETLSTDDEEATETDFLPVDESNSDTVFEYEGEKVSIGELFEHYANRTAPENLQSERQELESLRNELETRREAQSYIDLEDKPHAFFQQVFEKMVGDGSLPASTAESMIQAFRQSIANGEYSPDSIEQRASQLQKEREYQTQAEQLEEKERQIALRSEVLDLERKYNVQTTRDGKLTKEGEKIMSLLEGADSKHRQDKNQPQMTFTEAFGVAKKKGYFNTPPKTRAKMADEFRSKGTKSDAPDVQNTNMTDAINAFY